MNLSLACLPNIKTIQNIFFLIIASTISIPAAKNFVEIVLFGAFCKGTYTISHKQELVDILLVKRTWHLRGSH